MVDVGVVEIVDRFPAFSRGNAIGRQRMVEGLGAVHMPRIAHVIVVAAVAGGGEGIMPSHRVLHDLDQRLELAVEGLGGKARCRVAAAQQRAGDGGVQRIVQPLVHLARGQCLEIRALAARDVDHLDPLAGAHQIGAGRRRLDADVVDGVGQRLGQDVQPLSRWRCGAGDSQFDVGCSVLRLRAHVGARYRHDQNAVARDLEFGAVSRRAL